MVKACQSNTDILPLWHATSQLVSDSLMKSLAVIIIIIIKNVKIRVTLSWVTLQGHFTELLKSQTKWSAAGKWSQCHASVSSNSHVFKRLPNSWWEAVPGACSCHGKCAVAECRASGRPDHQSRRVSRPELTAGTNSRSQLEVVGDVRRCHATQTPVDQHTQPELDALRDAQAVKVPEQWGDVVVPPGREDQADLLAWMMNYHADKHPDTTENPHSNPACCVGGKNW